MMIGTCYVKNGTIVTNKTTYVVTGDTRPDVRRIFLAPGLVIAGGLSFLGIGFADVLYTHELALIGMTIFMSAYSGFQIARLTILDRVTRGTEQMSAIYGLHTTLQAVRHEINAEITFLKNSQRIDGFDAVNASASQIGDVS